MAADAAFSRESGRLRESGNRAKGRGCFIHAALTVCINQKMHHAAIRQNGAYATPTLVTT